VSEALWPHFKASSIYTPDSSSRALACTSIGYSAKVRLTGGFRFALPSEAFADRRANAIRPDDRIEDLATLASKSQDSLFVLELDTHAPMAAQSLK